MEFAPEFFYGEEREGFYVQPLMKRAWAAQIEVLEEIRRICKKHNIKFFAQWGTLLGAVRHKGFIPWDDDMDLAMIREDFEKFKRIVKDELPPGWHVYDYNDEGYDELMMRVVNSAEIKLEREFLGKFHGCPYSMGTDIFCMDHVPRNKDEQDTLLNLMNIADVLGVYWEDYKKAPEELGELTKMVEEYTGYQFDPNRPIKKQMLYLADRLAASYMGEDTDDIGFMYLLKDWPGHRFPKEVLDNIIEMPFENTTVPVPADYDRVLKIDYGIDYMTPVNRRGGHDYPFFKGQIEQLRDFYNKLGKELPPYFDMKLPKNNTAENAEEKE